MSPPSAVTAHRPRQKHPRFNIAATVMRYDGLPASWESVNLSEGGLFVRGRPLLEPGTEFEVGLWLPAANDSVEVQGRARVIWTNDPADPRSNDQLPLGMGLELLEMEPEDRRTLQQSIYSHGGPEAFEFAEDDDIIEVGVIIGSYRVVDHLGSGAMGDVYLAEHVQLGRRVALKRLRDRYLDDPNAVGRFFDEGRVVNRIPHDHIVEITDFISSGGDKCYVMELLSGRSLAETLKSEGALPIARVVDIAEQIADALSAVHDAKAIHRDLKPGNIMLINREGRPDFVKLLDFGVAKIESDGSKIPMGRTAPGLVLGTPGYMAPEQSVGDEIDHRADIYAFGVMLYQMATGQIVFDADSWTEMVVKHATETPLEPRCLRKEVPPALETLILQCLEKKPRHRPRSARDIVLRLREMREAGASSRPSTAPTSETLRDRLAVLARRAAHTATRRVPDLNRAALVAGVLLLGTTVAVGTLSDSDPTSEKSSHPSTAPSPDRAAEVAVTLAPSAPPAPPSTSVAPIAREKPTEPALAPAPAPKRKRARERARPLHALFDTTNASKRLQKARDQVRDGYVRLGIKTARSVTDAEPRNGAAWRLLGIAYSKLGDRDRACDAYRRYLLYEPKAPDRARVREILRPCF